MRNHLAFIPTVGLLAGLASCGGEKSADTAADTTTAVAPQPDTAPAPTVVAGAETGSALYGRCATCHQANGQGVPGAFPPLAGSDWVTGPPAKPIAVVLHGLQGEITVNGAVYNSLMMPYGTGATMTDAEVAAVLTYVRSNFGNTASPVTVEEVATVRAATAGRSSPMTAKELESLR